MGCMDLLQNSGFSPACFASQYENVARRNPLQQAVESGLLCGRETHFSIHIVSHSFLIASATFLKTATDGSVPTAGIQADFREPGEGTRVSGRQLVICVLT